MNSFFGSRFMALPRIIVRAGMLAALLLAGTVAGCGVRGALEAPTDAKVAGEATSADQADSGANSAAKPKPHKPFIFDGLLR